MKDRPMLLRGDIHIEGEYIIGKVIKNMSVEDKENCIQVLDNDHLDLYEDGYRAYLFEKRPTALCLDNVNYCSDVQEISTLVNYDVIEIIWDDCIKVLYRDDSDDNALVVTNQCNSNCIMCPDSDFVRNTKYMPSINKLIEHIRCIPSDAKHLTITGGEVGLLKDDLVTLLAECKRCLPDTEFLLLSNGRVFANTEFVDKICMNVPKRIRFAIPIYAEREELHDEITRVKGSFRQAVVGIKKLLARDIDIEIRIVVQKKNYQDLKKIAKFIVTELPRVQMVNIMALEMLGNAYKNKDEVWVNFLGVKNYLYEACLEIISAGIMVNLYNFPLCSLDKRLYGLAVKSITDYKVLFKEECSVCLARDNCGGFFFSTINMKDIKVEPIK